MSGCHRQGGASSGRAAAFTQAVKTLRAAAASAAEATECALTAEAVLPAGKELGNATKQRLVYIIDAAEGATGASDRAAAELQRLDADCRDRWDSTCDYLMARITIMADTAKERAQLGCARVHESDAPRSDGGGGEPATR